MKYNFEIKKEQEGQRLDLALSQLTNELTRSGIKKLIESNKVYVNDTVEYRAGYRVKEADKIKFTMKTIEDNSKLKPENIPLDIIYEDNDLIAINKVAGMVVHPSTGNWTGTVMNALMYYYSDLENVGNRVRSGLIHRLDKDTSGILLIGKTNKGLWHYSKLFSERKVKKTYLVAVNGKLPNNLKTKNTFEIKNYMGRNKGNRKKMTVVAEIENANNMSLTPDARIAHTIFEHKQTVDSNHLFFASPKTGRTHQIRVHSAHIGTPVIGDKVYSGKKNERMLLHAYKLQIKTPEGEDIELIAKPDKEFNENLKKFGFAAIN